MTRIQAKNTKVVVIDRKQADAFINNHHRQKVLKTKNKITSIAIIDVIDNSILGIMQTGLPRTPKKQRDYSNELLRLAFRGDVRVVGGVSKMMRFFIDNFDPADIFTYQDTTGENTKVYEHAGFTFVSQDKKKEYLVAPGRSLETGNRKEVLGMPYAMQYGPDRILGTKLGEVIDPATGKRKSNKRIFIEDLGWHVETTPGDKVYEWFNPNMTHYVYKITATDSDKYYYGVSHVKKANATIDDCLNDGYYGSGGEKYKNWKKKHYGNLEKEIVQIFKSKASAYSFEKEVLGDLWKNDPLCLNGISGGRVTQVHLRPDRDIQIKECPIHGSVKHLSNKCYKCIINNSMNYAECNIHGIVQHIGDKCCTCTAQKNISIQKCNIHGESKFQKNLCMKCHIRSSISNMECKIHGITVHAGQSCKKCIAEQSYISGICSIHGESKFHGETCSRCRSNETIAYKMCSIHGKTKFHGETCSKCSKAKSTAIKFCKIHRDSIYQGDSCLKCAISNAYTIKNCLIHGEVKHRGNSCATCNTDKTSKIRNCSKHGDVSFMGDTCRKCTKEKFNPNKKINDSMDEKIESIVSEFSSGKTISEIARDKNVTRDIILAAINRSKYNYKELREENKKNKNNYEMKINRQL